MAGGAGRGGGPASGSRRDRRQGPVSRRPPAERRHDPLAERHHLPALGRRNPRGVSGVGVRPAAGGRLLRHQLAARARRGLGRRRRARRAVLPGLLRRRRPRHGDPPARADRALRAALGDPPSPGGERQPALPRLRHPAQSPAVPGEMGERSRRARAPGGGPGGGRGGRDIARDPAGGSLRRAGPPGGRPCRGDKPGVARVRRRTAGAAPSGDGPRGSTGPTSRTSLRF